MTAERGSTQSKTEEFCVLDFTYMELGFIYYNEEIKKKIADSGFEGAFLLDDIETLFEARGEDIGLNKLPDFGGDYGVLQMHTFNLPIDIYKTVVAYYQGLVFSVKKQDFNV